MPLNMFGKTPIPDVLPDEMKKIINELKKSHSKKDCLRRAYKILTNKYRGYRVKTYTKIIEVFISNINKLWAKDGFLHCTSINYLMRTLLIKSDFFKENEIKIKWTLVWYISPHQYLQIKTDSSWINIDIWGYAYGIEFGDYAHGFY